MYSLVIETLLKNLKNLKTLDTWVSRPSLPRLWQWVSKPRTRLCT